MRPALRQSIGFGLAASNSSLGFRVECKRTPYLSTHRLSQSFYNFGEITEVWILVAVIFGQGTDPKLLTPMIFDTQAKCEEVNSTLRLTYIEKVPQPDGTFTTVPVNLLRRCMEGTAALQD